MDVKLVRHISALARIDLTEREVEEMADNLQHLLDYFESIREIDTEGIPPTWHSVELANILRPDIPKDPMPRQQILESAPQTDDGRIVVPKVIE